MCIRDLLTGLCFFTHLIRPQFLYIYQDNRGLTYNSLNQQRQIHRGDFLFQHLNTLVLYLLYLSLSERK